MVDKGKTFQVAANLIMIVLTLFCLLPFLLLIISSITQENALVRNGYSFSPSRSISPLTSTCSWIRRVSCAATSCLRSSP